MVGGAKLGGLLAALAVLGPERLSALADENGHDQPATPFSAAMVRQRAEELSRSAFSKPHIDAPAPFDKLSADQFRDIRFKAESAVWKGERLDCEVQLLPLGYLYDVPVKINLVDDEGARPLVADQRFFTIGPSIGKVAEGAPYGFSGFRLNSPINQADVLDEYLVFQGASFFRSVGRNQRYGVSARGLAIDTARPTGEEFPFFRTFWIEKPKPGMQSVVIHALLDSPSTTGAYRFVIAPGEATVIDVELTLFPRKDVTHVGIAPLTSMYRHGAAQNRLPMDYRPSAHDSEGLAILNGRGERLWRPVTNPRTLQTSAFVDASPKGFGLLQRDRNFSGYQDLDARYERRPTVWVEPRGAWGEGYVELIEIPSEAEIHDNIVCYWKPSKGLQAGSSYQFAYRMTWGQSVPIAWSGLSVVTTRQGSAGGEDQRLFVIDFAGPGTSELGALPTAEVRSSSGSIADLMVQENPEVKGVRVSFVLNTAGTDVVELRLGLKAKDRLVSESWLYRWTRA
ncbi:MAG: glucan biosynthesis protein [Hyphomicrobiaceae bacterium]|nr:glucan biosynthesis protein [Hyphomicrobiaceae bacterium]